MRTETAWRTVMQRDLAALQEQFGRLPMAPSRFLDTELLFTLVADHFPREDPRDAWALLTAHRFPARERLSPATRTALALARLRLPAVFGKIQWHERVQRYRDAPAALRLYEIREETLPCDAQQAVAGEETTRLRLERLDSAYDLGRIEAMRSALTQAPAWQRREARYAEPGRYRFSVRRDLYEVEITREVEAVQGSAQVPASLMPTVLPKDVGGAGRAPLSIRREELLDTAEWMETHAAPGTVAARPWHRLLSEVQLRILDGEGARKLEEDEAITINGLLHLVGMVGSGKSVLLTVLAVHCARQGLRVALLHADVATLMRDLALFDALRPADPDALLAVPFVGRSTRGAHLSRLHRSEALRAGLSLSRFHPGFGYLSTICPLDGLRDTSRPLPLGSEPCARLIPLHPTQGTEEGEDGPDESTMGEGSMVPSESDGSKDRGPWTSRTLEGTQSAETDDGRDARDCPFLPVCPQHAATRAMSSARIWLATPASLLSSGTRQPLVPEARRLIESVLCDVDVVLVDEADLMQTQFDDRYSPMEVLIGRGDPWLDRLARQVSTQIYHAGRPLVGRAADLDRWLTDHSNTQRAADSLYGWLRTEPDLRAWLGDDFFTGERLLQKVEAALSTVARPEELAAWRDEADRFGNDPLGMPGAESAWRQAAYLNLVRNDQARARQSLVSWFTAAMPTVVTTGRDTAAGLRHTRKHTTRRSVEWYVDRLLVALLVGVLDHALQNLIDEWPSAARYLDVDQGEGGLFHALPDDLVRLVPESPMGAILGFQYYDPDNTGDGELRFFRLRGIGRALLYHLHDALWESDGVTGPHTVLASGTSWAPGSWRYHLHVPPSLLLLPDRRDDTAQTLCSFDPVVDPGGSGVLYVSGHQKIEERLRSLREMVRALATPSVYGQRKSRFDEEFDQLDEHRRRILLVVGSYQEAEAVGEVLALLRDDAERREVLTLVPDATGEGDPTWRAPKGRLPRSLLEGLATQPATQSARFLVAPLRAIERGYNILTENVVEDDNGGAEGDVARDGARVAAIGSVYFLVRPMPVPGDLHESVQHMNAWALDRTASTPAADALIHSAVSLRAEATKRFRTLLNHRYVTGRTPHVAVPSPESGEGGEDDYALATDGPASGTEEEALVWTQFVLVWQCIGRLLRGGVAARVHFVDAKWAPHSASGDVDDAGSSMLLGFRAVLARALRHPDAAQRAVAQALYGSAVEALALIDGVRDQSHREAQQVADPRLDK